MAISKDSSAPLVVVVGATGAQGSSVVNALIESDKPYRIRGFTRDPSKAEAQALSRKGVEFFAVDPTPENNDQVFKGFEGATYAFVVTAGHFVKGQELVQGKLLVDASKAANVKLLVWSGLPSATKNSHGKYTNVFLFDEKDEITAYAKSINIPFVNVQAGGFMSNYTTNYIPRKLPDGSFAIFAAGPPDALIPLIDTKKDYGVFVRKAIEQPLESGTVIYAYSELLNHNDITRILSEITGKKVSYVQLPQEQFTAALTGAGVPAPFAAALTEMWIYASEFGYWGSDDIKGNQQGLARKLNTWEDFVKETDWSKLLA